MRHLFSSIHIPPDWTAEQAHAVVEFLDDLSTQIWEIHEQKILDAMEKKETLLIKAARGEEDGCLDDDEFPP